MEEFNYAAEKNGNGSNGDSSCRLIWHRWAMTSPWHWSSIAYCAIYSFWAVSRISTYQVIALTKLVENLLLRTELHGRYPKTYETASAMADGDREDEELLWWGDACKMMWTRRRVNRMRRARRKSSTNCCICTFATNWHNAFASFSLYFLDHPVAVSHWRIWHIHF